MRKSEKMKKQARYLTPIGAVVLGVILFFVVDDDALTIPIKISIIIIYLFIESIILSMIIGITKLAEKFSGEKPSQQSFEKNKKSTRYKNVKADEQKIPKCPNCGNEAEEGMIFCDKCGTRIQ